jgi:tetratricopeptide (TPR) repeat protein
MQFKYYKDVLKIQEDVQIMEEIASLYLMEKKIEEADEWIDKVLKLNPNKRAYGIKGWICLCRENLEEAKKYIKAGLEIDPKDEFLNKLYDDIKDK